MIYLLLMVFWLFVGLFLVGWHRLHPEIRGFRIWGTDISLGWFAILLAVYNLVRWWSGKSQARALRQAQEANRQMEAMGGNSEERPADPNFLFTDEARRSRNDKPGA
jgi:hypothetical protein